MSRNSERIGAVEQPTEPPKQSIQQEKESSFFSFPSPTELVDLPSKGLWYPEGHPVRGRETIEIGYMTTKHEEILVNRTFIEKGVVIDKLLDALMIDPKIPSKELFSCDRKALMIAARISGYGTQYKPNVRCPDCGASSPQEFDLRELKPKEIDESLNVSDRGTFVIPLHQNPADDSSPLIANVEVRMLKGGDEERIAKTAEQKKKKKLPEEPIADLFKEIIVSVKKPNGEEGSVEDFIQQAPMYYMVHLREAYKDLSPNLDMEFFFTCPKCEAENILDIPMNANFFRHNQQVSRKRS